MVLLMVVEVEEAFQPLIQLPSVQGGVQVDIVPLECPPQPLDVNVVQRSSLAIHADADAFPSQVLHPLSAGKLAALVGVDYLRLAVLSYSLLQHRKACLCLQAVGQAPADHEAAVHVDDGRQVHKPLFQRNVGDVHLPDLVAVAYLQAPQQVGVNILRMPQPAQVLFWVDGLQAHEPEQPSDPLVVHLIPLITQVILHLQHPVRGPVQVALIQKAHHLQVLPALPCRCVVEAAAVDAQQTALGADAEFAGRLHQLSQLCHSPSLPELFFKNSFSNSSLPILA